MPTLYYSPTSPYVRKVMVVLSETGQTGRVALVPASGTAITPSAVVTGRNPLGKIPALEREDGGTLYDSRVICRYLAETGPAAGADLYPAPPRLWDSLTLEATGDGIMDAALLVRYEFVLRPPQAQSAAWADGQWAKIERALDTLEGRWTGYLAGPLCIGQIAVGCALAYLDLRFADRPWRMARPGLTAWADGFARRPAMLATQPTD